MADKIAAVRIKQNNGYTAQIPFYTTADNVGYDNNHTVAETLDILNNAVSGLVVAQTAAQMIDTDKIYVYNGSESGYTKGNWYYYDGSIWASGGVYLANPINIDDTLSVEGDAADAAAVGQAIQSTSEKLENENQNQMVYSQISGKDFVTFENGIANKPISQIIINIQPKQDLHGYSKPYQHNENIVNLIPDGTDTSNGYVANAYLDINEQYATNNYEYSYSNAGYYISEYFPITAGQTYTWSVTGTAPSNPSICFYQYIEGEGYQYVSGYKPNGTMPYTFIVPEGVTHARSSQRTQLFQLQLGENATSIVPYSNICPITGITSLQIANTGRNLAAKNKLTEDVDYTQYYPCLLSPGYYHLSFTKAKNNNAAVRMKRCSNFADIKTARTQSGTMIYRVTGTADSGNNQYSSSTSFNFRLLQYTNIVEFFAGSVSGQHFNDVDIERYEDWIKFSENGEIALFNDGGYHRYNFTFSDSTFEYSENASPITVYGGKWNSNGNLTVTWGYINNYNPTNDNQLLTGKWISDRDQYVLGTYPSEGAQVVYQLDSSNYITYTFQPQQILMINGTNYLRTSAGVFDKVKSQVLLNDYLSEENNLTQIKNLNYSSFRSELKIPETINIGDFYELSTATAGNTYEKIIPIIKNEKYEIKLTYGNQISYEGYRAIVVTDENNIVQQKIINVPLLNDTQTISFTAICSGWLNITCDLQCQHISIYSSINPIEEKIKNSIPLTYKVIEKDCNKLSFTAKNSQAELDDTFSFSNGISNSAVKSLIFKLDPRQKQDGTFLGWSGLSIKIGHGNLYNRTQAAKGYLLNRDTGVIYQNSKYQTTQFINIHNVTSLFIQYYHYTNVSEYGAWRIAFYNKNKEFIKSICSETPRPGWATAASNSSCYKELPLLVLRNQSSNQMIPTNAEYVRIAFSNYRYAIIMTNVSEYNYTFPKTIYGGQLDVINGKLTVTKNFISSYDPETSDIDFSTGGWISSIGEYDENEMNSPTTGSQVIYDCDPQIITTDAYPVIIEDPHTLIVANQKHGPGAFTQTGSPCFNHQAGIKIEYAVSTDQTLSDSGIPADAKATGDIIKTVLGSSGSNMIASKNIAINSYFCIDNKLYQATTTILNGDTIVPGTNCTLTDIATVLNTLSSLL